MAPPSHPLRVVQDLPRLSDEALMEAYRDGTTAAFDVLVVRYRERVFGFLRRLGLGPERAEEVRADVFLKVHRAAPRYRPTAKFRTYLYTVAYRAALNAREKARNQLDSPVGASGELDLHGGSRPSPERELAARRAVSALERELAELPAAHRDAFVLYYGEELSCAEAAEALGVSAAEVKGRLAYARKLLRTRLAPVLSDRRSP